MGMDGLSRANTGALNESTSADYTNRVDQIVHQDPTNDARMVQNLVTNQAVRAKDESEEGSKQHAQKHEKKEEEEFEDGLVETPEQSDEEDEEDFNIEDLDNPNKDFYVKLNSKDDIIELYDSSTDKLIETISGNELQELVRKLNMASGIFVNKKV